MGFVDAVKTGLTKYAVFRGRATRSEYWWFVLFQMLALALALLLSVQLERTSWIFTVVWLGLILPGIAIAVRRLHDVGRSGAWFLLSAVPFGAFVLLYFYTEPSQPHDNQYGSGAPQT